MFEKPYREGGTKESGFSMQIIGEILRQAGGLRACLESYLKAPNKCTFGQVI